ncbi:hypothetical protein SAMN05518849_11884 [Sphingobium sp. AP50]|uniref:hypothetical protein n=1 Tax=Sphingobium sp. AP50 TaxID=1884369 RepID=UPI0008C7154F|nr:hypothetical protein [Sphingobium sp. AP50]SEJ92307.1 hypothetical protein SAMN05518849_11884 [Sphingobium sp. AP50]
MHIMSRVALCALGAPLLFQIAAMAQKTEPSVKDRARSAAAASRTRTGSSEALQSNFVTPGLSGQSITTIDGKTGFAPNVNCQKTSTLLEVLVQPGSTGDLTQVRILHDRDLNGAYDSLTQLPVPVSGLCGNGIISCNPGTWEGCRSYGWSVDSTLKIDLKQTPMTSLSGCYCINSSCGTSLAWANMADILKDLGGGIVGALTTADPRIGIAQAQVEGTAIRYSGAQTTACLSNPKVEQTRYRATPEILAGDAQDVAQSSSIFQAVKASPAATGKAEQISACTITREISSSQADLESIIRRTSGGYATNQTGGAQVSFLMGSPSDNSLKGGACTLFDYRMTIDVADADRLKAVRLARYFADDWAQVRVDGQLIAAGPSTWSGMGLPPGKCDRKATYDARPALDITAAMTPGTHEIWLRVAVGDEGEAYAQIEADLDLSCRTTERLVDRCNSLVSQRQCTLRDETVDDVTTFRNGIGTGLSPLPQTRMIGTGACAITITRDFFARNRRYACIVDTGSQEAPDLTRAAHIIDRSTETMLSDRIKTADGGYQETQRAFSLPAQDPVATCEPICKTRKARTNSDAALDGVVGHLQISDQGWDSYYHLCSADNVCPAGAGEDIVSACGCLDDFPEAVTMMQTVRLAGADLVCTARGQ